MDQTLGTLAQRSLILADPIIETLVDRALEILVGATLEEVSVDLTLSLETGHCPCHTLGILVDRTEPLGAGNQILVRRTDLS